MKRLSFALLITHLAILPALAADPPFRAGAAVVDITPTKLPAIVAGGFLEAKGNKIEDRLYVRAIVMESGGTRLGFAIVDTCMMAQSLIDDAKQGIQKGCGIPVDHLMISATHTHSAPAAMGCLGTRQDKDYAAVLPGKIADAVVAANGKLQPAKVGWASVDDWHHTHNRRWVRRPETKIVDPFGNATGLAHMHPGYLSKDIIGPSGPVDPGLSVVSIRTADGTPLAVLANYSQHYFGAPAVSADYYGYFCESLAKMMGQEGKGNGPFVAAMSQGTSGDQMWMDYGSPKSDLTLKTYAEAVARTAFQAVGKVEYKDSVPLGIVERRLDLAYRVPNDSRLDWARPIAAKVEDDLPKNQREVYAKEALILHERQRTQVKLQAIRIGDLTIATLPNEVYAITGLKLKAQSPSRAHFNIELANGAEGYIPPPEQHVLGGYTTWPARTAGLEVQAEPKIVETLLGALEAVTGQKRRPLVDEHGPYAEAVLKLKPGGYWRLNEIQGEQATNAVAGGQPAMVSAAGHAWYLPGVATGTGVGSDEALRPSAFSGSNKINRSVHLAGGAIHADMKHIGRYSIALWFWLGESSGASDRVGKLIDASGGLAVKAKQDRDHRVRLTLGDAVTRIDWNASEWHFLVAVRDGETIRLFVDGQNALEAPSKATSHLQRILVGDGLQGKIDELAVFDRALDAGEIEMLWKAGGVK